MSVPKLGPAISYVDILDAWTEEDEVKRNEEGVKYNPLRPSGIGKCGRQLAYEYARFKDVEGFKDIQGEDKEASVVRLLGLGHTIEDKLFRDFDYKIPNDILKRRYTQQLVRFMQFPDGTWLEGSMDGCFFLKNHRVLVDVKTKKNKFSSHFRDSWMEMPNKLAKMPSAEKVSDKLVYVDDLEKFLEVFRIKDPFMAMNLYQLNLYYHCKDNFIIDSGIDHCALLYYNKNDSRLFELRFRPNKKIADERLALVHDIVEAVESGDPEKVDREMDLGSVMCAFCPHKDRCWRDEEVDARQAYFNTFPKKKWPTSEDKLDDKQREDLALLTELMSAATNAKEVEKRIAKDLGEKKITKIRLDDGSIYDIKFLKSEGWVLRKGKL
jgi:hypothetical protein